MLDQDVVNLAKAIRQVETGNRQVSGASGELASRYQFMPATWKSSASKYLGDANAPLTLENENKVAYLKILDWKKAGYNPAQIASMWNSGSPKWEGKVGVNKQGVKYDVPKYVNSVYSIYKQNKLSNPETNGSKKASIITNNNQINQENEDLLNKPEFTTTGNEGLGMNLGKATANLPGDTINFISGLWNMINPISTAKRLGQFLSGSMEGVVKEGITATDVLKEVPKAVYETIVPKTIQQAITGDIKGATKTLVEQPTSSVLPLALLAKGITSGKSVGTKAAINTLKKTTEVTGDMAKGAAKYSISQASGLKPTTISEVIKNPESFTQDNMAATNRQSVAGKIWNEIEGIMKEKSQTGSAYEGIRKINKSVYINPSALKNVLDKYNINLDNWKITPTKESLPMSTGDINALQNFIDTYGLGGKYSYNAFLNARTALSTMADYFRDPTKTTASDVMARELRAVFDSFGKKQIEGLSQLDESYKTLSNEYKAIKKEYLTRDAATGEIRFKDGAITRIANATNKGRESVLARLENLSPGITKEINIIKAIEDIENSGGNKIGAYMRVIPTGIGFSAGGVLGAFIGLVMSSPTVVIPLLRSYGKMIKIKDSTINAMINKLENGKKLSIEEQEIFYDMLKVSAALSQGTQNNQKNTQ